MRLLNHACRCYSDGVLFDATPPNTSAATLASQLAVTRNVQRVAHTVSAEVLGIVDPETGIRQYMAALGLPGAAPDSLYAFRDAGTTMGIVSFGGLSLDDGEVGVWRDAGRTDYSFATS